MSNFDKLLSGSTIRFTVFVLLPVLMVLILLPIEMLAGGGINDQPNNAASASTTHRQGQYTAPPAQYTAPPAAVRDSTGKIVQQGSVPDSQRAGMRRQLGHVAPVDASGLELKNNRRDPVNANRRTAGQADIKTGPQVVRDQTKVLSKQEQQESRIEKNKSRFAEGQVARALEDPRSRRTAKHVPGSSFANDKMSNMPGLPESKRPVRQSAEKAPGAAHVPSKVGGSAIPVRANSRMAKKLTGSPVQQGPTKVSPSTTRIIASPSKSSTASTSKTRPNVDKFGRNFKGGGK